MSTLGLAHTVFGLLSLASGLAIFTITKGTTVHRVIGYVYVVSMLALNITALMIYRVFGTFGPFHVLALISLFSLVSGFIPVYFKRPRGQWVNRHYESICWSYVGLLAATASEIAVRLPFVRGFGWIFGLSVFLASVVVVFCGAFIIYRKREQVITYVMSNLKASGKGD